MNWGRVTIEGEGGVEIGASVCVILQNFVSIGVIGAKSSSASLSYRAIGVNNSYTYVKAIRA